ncbi:MAG: Carbamoyl dehydratase HypE [Syntrophus sp. SKADARSKE-3]|nr:Carbamoyl dehydratase HypE [Syntrophus sp. SKADARSKE-3]
MKHNRILLEHGGGGLLSNELISKLFLPFFRNEYLDRLEDGAVFNMGTGKLCMSTDSYVVKPIFFPGGDIGSLAVHGTVNDLAMCGGKPLFLSAGFIIEEGFPMDDLVKIIASMSEAASRAGVQIVTGDTKVVNRGAADGLFINTSGIGVINYGQSISVRSILPGDVVIINGTVGDHGAAILAQREDLGLESDILSDSAPLNGLVENILATSAHIHCMRDATRGGLGAIMAEIAAQSGLEISLDENLLPIRDDVRGICEILGFDPLFLANEGKMAIFCPETEADKVLAVMHAHEYGHEALVIGNVTSKSRGRLIMKTIIGGMREVDLPTGELVPRIC